MAARTITVLIGAILLAVLVVRTALVEAYASSNPAIAGIAWPRHPSVIMRKGLAEVGAAAAAGRTVNMETVRTMLATASKAPLAPEPYLVRGVEAQVAGDEAISTQAFLEARRRDPRSIPARFFLADRYLRSGQTQQGLSEIAALTRLVPQSLDRVAPQLAAFARMPGAAAQAKRLLRDQPQLEPWLLGELAFHPADADLALALWSGRNGEQEQLWQQRLVNTMVSSGRVNDARIAWGRFNPTARPVGELFDPKFEGNVMPPFGWTFASGASGVAEPEGDGRLHLLYYGRDNVVLASQLLQLKPGTHRFSMRINFATPTANSIAWVVRCLSPSRDLASINLNSARRGALVADFTVPSENCSSQQLDLVGTTPELPEQAELSIADLSLSRRSK